MIVLAPLASLGETVSVEEQKLDFVAERCANSAADGIPLEECQEDAARSFEIRQLMRAVNAMKAGRSATEAGALYGVPAEVLSDVEGASSAASE
jgi:hypothetical protein